MASPSGEVQGTLDTAEKLQTFLAALNSIDKTRRKDDFLLDLDCYEGNLLQFLKLLRATYKKKGGRSMAFCRMICNLMIRWSSQEMRQDLDEEELADAMFDAWKRPGAHPLVPEALTSALEPEIRITFLTAAEVLLGSTRPSMISSGLKLTKVLTAMLAIQVYMHKRDTSEVLCVELRDVETVDDLSRFNLPEEWEDALTHAANEEHARKVSVGIGHPAAGAGKKRKWHTVPEPSGTGKPVFRCRRCDRALASVDSLRNHLRWHCHGVNSKPQKQARTSVVPSDDSGSGQAESERKTNTDVVSRQEANDEEADQDPPADPRKNGSASGGRAENGTASGGSAESQEENLGDATVRLLARAYAGKMDKQLKAAARMVAKENQ